MAERYVAADPYPWPFDGRLTPQNTALIVIDMQTDFCGIGGYVDKMGYDLSLTRAPIEPIRARNRGAAVLLVSSDLDEILEIADRLVVMFNGLRLVHEARIGEADLTEIGRHMAGH